MAPQTIIFELSSPAGQPWQCLWAATPLSILMASGAFAEDSAAQPTETLSPAVTRTARIKLRICRADNRLMVSEGSLQNVAKASPRIVPTVKERPRTSNSFAV